MSGGSVRSIYGGAGHSTTKGNRIINVTGGTVQFGVLGGSDSNGTTDTSSATTETFTHHEQGNKGVLDSYQKMVIQYRQAIYAADSRIIDKCNDLFMGIY